MAEITGLADGNPPKKRIELLVSKASNVGHGIQKHFEDRALSDDEYMALPTRLKQASQSMKQELSQSNFVACCSTSSANIGRNGDIESRLRRDPPINMTVTVM
jgi:hypothetical protein